MTDALPAATSPLNAEEVPRTADGRVSINFFMPDRQRPKPPIKPDEEAADKELNISSLNE